MEVLPGASDHVKMLAQYLWCLNRLCERSLAEILEEAVEEGVVVFWINDWSKDREQKEGEFQCSS